METPRKFIIAIINLRGVSSKQAEQVYCIHHSNLQGTYIEILSSLVSSLPNRAQYIALHFLFGLTIRTFEVTGYPLFKFFITCLVSEILKGKDTS